MLGLFASKKNRGFLGSRFVRSGLLFYIGTTFIFMTIFITRRPQAADSLGDPQRRQACGGGLLTRALVRSFSCMFR